MSNDLRDTIAGAITEEHHRRARERIEASPEQHADAFAEVALAVVQPELDRLRADLRWARSELAKADAENNANGRRAEQAKAERDQLRAAVERARALPARSTHGFIRDYVPRAALLAALDQPKEGA